MLFLFGTGNKLVSTEPLPNLSCAHCGNTGTLLCTVFSRYFSLFWIPVFPIGKTSLTVCQHCKQTLTTREMPASYQAPVQAVQSRARTPLTSFALLLVAGVLAVLFAGLVAYTKFFGSKPPTTTTATSPVLGARWPDRVGSLPNQGVARQLASGTATSYSIPSAVLMA